MLHPRGLYVLFFTEMWERFSYYGMRSLLLLYMTQSLNYSVAQAGTIYGLYTGAVYFTPIVGGYFADRILGQQRAILIGAILMSFGHFVLAIPHTAAFFSALILLILGNGLFKPNISVIVGKLYAPDDPRRDAAFSLFYVGINLGAFLSPFVCGTLGQRVGWHWGFASAGIGMLLACLIFITGRSLLEGKGMHTEISRIATGYSPEKRSLTHIEWQRLGALGILAIVGNVIFWSAFEQAGSSLTLLAEHNTDLSIQTFHWQVPSSWFQAANPLFIAILGPLFSYVWPRLAQRQREPSTPIKFFMGLALPSIGFLMLSRAGTQIDHGKTISMTWLLAAYFFNTCGELCLSPVGLSVVTKLSPKHMSSLTMGLWFSSVAIANVIGGQFSGSYDSMSKASFFLIPSLTLGIGAMFLLALHKSILKLMHGVR